MLKDKVKYQYDALEEYGGRWKELYFFIDGTTLLETDIWDTEVSCQEHIDYILNAHGDKTSWVAEFNNGITVHIPDISHAIPMPIGEDK